MKRSAGKYLDFPHLCDNRKVFFCKGGSSEIVSLRIDTGDQRAM